jgi:hypothetical protein
LQSLENADLRFTKRRLDIDAALQKVLRRRRDLAAFRAAPAQLGGEIGALAPEGS